MPARTLPLLPVDALGKDALLACGTVALKAGYAGPAIEVGITRGGRAAGKVLDIGPDGLLEAGALAGFIATADAGTAAHVTRCFDQTGNGRDLRLDGSVPGPIIGKARLGGREMISWGASAGEMTLAIPGSVAIDQGDFGAFFLGRGEGMPGAVTALADFGRDEFKVYGADAVNPGSLEVSASGRNEGFAVPIDGNPQLLSLVSGTGRLVLRVDEDGSRARPLPARRLRGGHLGYISGGAPGGFDLFGFVLAGHAPDPATLRALRQGAYRRFGLAPQLRDQIFVLGDSRTQGADTEGGWNWPNQLLQLTGVIRPMRLFNLGVGGATLADLATRGVPFVAARYRPGARNIAVVFGGLNDVLRGATAGQALDALRRIAARLQAAGYTVVIVNELPYPPLLAFRALVRDSYRRGALAADALVDPAALPVLADPGNRANFPDGLHPDTAACGSLAGLVAAHLAAFLK